MYTVDTAGFNRLMTKLSLDITKDDFVSRMHFEDDAEKERCLLYLDLKGVSYHTVLANYIGLDEDGTIQFKKVKNLYVYDKRIRNILYKFLSALEEGIRGFISNIYCGNISKIKKLSKSICKSVNEGSSLSKELENLDFGKLTNISYRLSKDEKKKLFGNIDHLKENLSAVRQLRNAISHHRLLFAYEDFYECYLGNGKFGESLIDNIMNLMQLLNPFYRDFLKNEINQSAIDDQDITFITTLPNNAILHIM